MIIPLLPGGVADAGVAKLVARITVKPAATYKRSIDSLPRMIGVRHGRRTNGTSGGALLED
jgi:hypothetical protein